MAQTPNVHRPTSRGSKRSYQTQGTPSRFNSPESGTISGSESPNMSEKLTCLPSQCHNRDARDEKTVKKKKWRDKGFSRAERTCETRSNACSLAPVAVSPCRSSGFSPVKRQTHSFVTAIQRGFRTLYVNVTHTTTEPVISQKKKHHVSHARARQPKRFDEGLCVCFGYQQFRLINSTRKEDKGMYVCGRKEPQQAGGRGVSGIELIQRTRPRMILREERELKRESQDNVPHWVIVSEPSCQSTVEEMRST